MARFCLLKHSSERIIKEQPIIKTISLRIHYTFMIEAGEWKITDAIITNIEQID